MKRIFIFTIFAAICGMVAMAQGNPVITHQTSGNDRYERFFGYTQPKVDYDNAKQELVIDDCDYLNITIISQQTGLLCDYEITSEGNISVGHLPNGYYTLTITVQTGMAYVYTFIKGGATSHVIPTGRGGFQPNSGTTDALDAMGYDRDLM